MRSSKAALVLLLLLCPLLPSYLLIAQTATGQANGTVSDQSGAFVPGATVTLTSQGTNISNRTTTNNNGFFVFINLPPGSYVLKAEKSGFKTVQTASFEIGVNQTVTQQLSFAVGTASEVVNVTAESTLIDSSTTELGTVIPEKTVSDLPLNGRNFTQLLTLTPGVTPVSTSQNRNVGCCEGNVGLPGSGFSDGSFHGQENRSKLYFYDGIINTNVRGPTYIVIPNIDLIQEFKVVGHDAKAEFGGAMGGVVNLVSKSGTDSFHGSAFEYLRNNFFDARNSVTDATCTPARCPQPGQVVPSGPVPFHQNQFGATLTGPVIRNKTFFSVGYDGWRYSQPSQNLSFVPTAAEIAGDFSNELGNRGGAHLLFNPFSTRVQGTTLVRDRFTCDGSGNPMPLVAGSKVQQAGGTPCNKIPQALIFTPMQKFFQTYAPAPNFTGGTLNFIQSRPTINNSNAYTARIDHRFRDADNVFFRYTEQRNTIFTPIGDVGSTSGGSQGRNYGGGWVHTFSPSLILDVRAGYAGRPGVDAGQQNKHSAGTDPMKQMGFVDVDKYQGLLVRLDTAEWTAGNNNDFGVRGSAPRENPNWSVTPNVSWLKGNHNIKVGAWYIEAKRIQLNTFQRYSFSDEQTRGFANNQTGSGLSLASALLGLPNQLEAQLPIEHGGPVRFKYASWAGYLQDEWKLRPTVTVSLGLRYDYVTQPKTTDGRLWNALDLKTQLYIVGVKTMPGLCSQTKQAPCIPDGIDPVTGVYTASRDFRTDPHFANLVVAGKSFFAPPPIKDNWGPRIGIAWQVHPKTVVRMGYGLYWDPITARSQYAQNDLETFVWPDATAFAGTTNACSASGCTAFLGGASGIDIISQQKAGFATPLPPYTGPTSLPWNGFPNGNADDPNFKDGYSNQWNLEVQQELTSNSMFSIAYVGSSSGRLPYTGRANAASRAFPNGTPNSVVDATRQMPWVTAGISYARSIGRANYNALETKFQRRFSRGLQTLVSYTWGKSIDTSSGYFNSAENGAGGGATVQNFYDQKTARGVSSFDITHFFSWATVYELPFGRGKTWLQSGPLSWLLGNWQANYIFQARSGQPYNLAVTGDTANLRGSSPAATGDYARPNLIADPFAAGPVAANPDPLCQKTISQGGRAADQIHTVKTWFNPCAFGIPIGSFGNLGRNAFRGSHVVNMDFSMFKGFQVREGMNLQLRFEAFNVFNIQNYDVPGGVNQSSGSGTTIGTANSNAIASTAGLITGLAQGTTPRQLQFGVRFVF